jgi:hypothetical protein
MLLFNPGPDESRQVHQANTFISVRNTGNADKQTNARGDRVILRVRPQMLEF